MYNSFGPPGDAGGSPFVPIPRFFQQCAALSTTMTDESLETSIILLLGDKKKILVCNSNKSYQNPIKADSKMFGFLTLLNEIYKNVILAIID